MRLKDLLSLVNGSVVQLDRDLGDEVEIRVNNCVIARGEVVAVEGNYGVRILKMMSGALSPN
jgi:flagellar motor switch protein FliN/FliY